MPICEHCGSNVKFIKQHYDKSIKCNWYREYMSGKPLNEFQMCLLMDARLIDVDIC